MGNPWLIWNVRGMGRASKRRVFKKHIAHLKPGVVLIQETKIGVGREKCLDSWAQALGMRYCLSLANGSAGGLISLWRDSELQVEQTVSHQRFIALWASIPHTEVKMLLINVYGPHTDAERHKV